MNGCIQDNLSELAGSLISAAGLVLEDFAIAPMTGGRNNKVFAITSAGRPVALLKKYFHHPQDTRDRLAHEVAFLKHLEAVNCSFGAKILAVDRGAHASLMDYLHGASIPLESVSPSCIDQASAFFCEANQATDTAAALALPNASEACFSIDEHVRTTQRRVDRLSQLVVNDDVDRDASRFINDELNPQWNRVRASIAAQWSTAESAAILPQNERCLSPSDFGFHNALREASGRIRFLDFEYAGWDDPAKLVSDFANQPDMLLDRALSNRFRDAVLSAGQNTAALSKRIQFLEPLYQVKWSCICLNDFLSPGHNRFRFTDGSQADHHARRMLQLKRARQMLARSQDSTSPQQ